MTEEEAKTKWCPFARIPDGEPVVAVNRPEPYGDVPKCLGSFCMMWRWQDDPTGAQPPDGPEPNMTGWCGLAGKPQGV